MEEDHHYTPDQEDNYHQDDHPQVDIQVEQYQYQQVVLETADSSDNSANNDQNQQQQPPQYQPQPPPQQQQPPQYQPPRQPPPPYQPPVQFPPQQPTQAPPRPIQYLAPQPPRPVPFPPQSPQHQNYANQPPPQQYPPQQPPYQPPQQFPPQNLQNNYANAAPNQQNHPFGQPPSPAKFPPQPQYPPPAGSSSQPPQGYNDIPQPSKKHQATPPVQVGYNKPNYQPPQQQQQQQHQPQQQYYSLAPAQGVPMQCPYGPQGTPMNTNMMNPIGTDAWRTGLFDCMDDPNNALITAFVPCLTFGQIAEVLDNGTTSCGTSGLLYGLVGAFIGVPFIMSCTYRTKIRSRYGLVETPAPDWVTHLFCEPCALCQEYRELNMRGLDPSIGWQGNIAKAMQQQQPNMMTPPTNHMMR